MMFIANTAMANERITSCRQASERYKSLAVTYDKLFQEFVTIKNIEKSKSFGKWIIQYHEDYKDTEYKYLYETSMQMVRSRLLSLQVAEVWRTYMEASIDIAYASAGDNLQTDSLGRTENHYARKIYDACVSNR